MKDFEITPQEMARMDQMKREHGKTVRQIANWLSKSRGLPKGKRISASTVRKLLEGVPSSRQIAATASREVFLTANLEEDANFCRDTSQATNKKEGEGSPPCPPLDLAGGDDE